MSEVIGTLGVDENVIIGTVNADSEISGSVASDGSVSGAIKPTNLINVTVSGGARGKSAYELWVEAGNVGTIDDFFGSLKGADGGAYIHPESHSAGMILETSDKQFVSPLDRARLSGYIHDQIASKKTWIITHNLEKYPSVSVVDTGGSLVMGDVLYVSVNKLEIYFNNEFSGKAYLN